MKLGYNFEFKIDEIASADGTTCVVIDESMWHQSRSFGPEQIISGYPYGHGRYEDTVVDQIHETMQEFCLSGRDSGLEVRSAFGRWQQPRWIVPGCTLGDELVQGLIKSLSRLNRVTVFVRNEAVKS